MLVAQVSSDGAAPANASVDQPFHASSVFRLHPHLLSCEWPPVAGVNLSAAAVPTVVLHEARVVSVGRMSVGLNDRGRDGSSGDDSGLDAGAIATAHAWRRRALDAAIVRCVKQHGVGVPVPFNDVVAAALASSASAWTSLCLVPLPHVHVCCCCCWCMDDAQATVEGAFVPHADDIASRVAYLTAHGYVGVSQAHPVIDADEDGSHTTHGSGGKGATTVGANGDRDTQPPLPFGTHYSDTRVMVWYAAPTGDPSDPTDGHGDGDAGGAGMSSDSKHAGVEQDSKDDGASPTTAASAAAPAALAASPPPPPVAPLLRALSCDQDATFFAQPQARCVVAPVASFVQHSMRRLTSMYAYVCAGARRVGT